MSQETDDWVPFKEHTLNEQPDELYIVYLRLRCSPEAEFVLYQKCNDDPLVQEYDAIRQYDDHRVESFLIEDIIEGLKALEEYSGTSIEYKLKTRLEI